MNRWCWLQRDAGVLVWIPPLLLGPLLSLPGGPAGVVGGIALVLVLAAAAATAVVTSRKPGTVALSRTALAVLAAGVAVSTTFGEGWLPVWVLLAICCPAVLRGRWLLAALVLVVAGGTVAARAVGQDTTTIEVQAFVLSLSAGATTSFLRLMETVEELRRTREELARLAVAEERERFSRDLHDLLGHTLSVMVVKAQAVRRLVATDPTAAAAHASDIEDVGRRALLDVRQAVDAMRTPSLADEVDGARRALDAAGIRTSVVGFPASGLNGADEPLAWVVREGATNVLRHSAATRCRIELTQDAGLLRLTMTDDGVGGPAPSRDRQGGLDGLRRRLIAARGSLDVDPDVDGFCLTATIPATIPATTPTAGR